MGDGMVRMLDTMRLPVYSGAAGDARAAVQAGKPEAIRVARTER